MSDSENTHKFLTSAKIAGVTRVLAADQEEYNELQIRDETFQDGSNVMVSRWVLTPEQRKVIADGGSIYLGILGEVHPPVLMSVNEN